jgi:hypothetical protein
VKIFFIIAISMALMLASHGLYPKKFTQLVDPFAHPSDRINNAQGGCFTLEGIIITGKKRVATLLYAGERCSIERGDVIHGYSVRSIGMHYIDMERGNEKMRLTLE